MVSETTHEKETERARPVQERVYLALIKTAAKFEADLNRVFRSFELTHATYSILKILSGRGYEGSSCGQIAEQLIAEVPDMTRLLDRLERLGYVKRERSKADRRMVRVSITEKGQSAVEALREPTSEFYRGALSHVPEDRLLALLALLDDVRREGAAGRENRTESVEEQADAEL